MQIVIIAAVAENGVIGQGGVMPWRLKSDMRHFRELTTGKPVVMGRKTYDSLHIKPLPNRTNIVVTRDKNFTAPGVLVAQSLDAALQAARGDAMRRGSDIMVIGGAEIYAQAMPLADRLEITQVHATPRGRHALSGDRSGALARDGAHRAPAGRGGRFAFATVRYARGLNGR